MAEGVLITGVYGSGKSSVAAEIAYLLEQRRQPYALLDLDFLGWGVVSFDEHAPGDQLMLRNLAAVASNYRDAGISVFVLAWFVRDRGALRNVREAVGVPLRMVRLSVPLPDIERRAERRQVRQGQGRAGTQPPGAGALPEGGDPGDVAGEEADQPGGERRVAAAQQRHVARRAEGQGPPRRAVAACHQHGHQQRLGQPPKPVTPHPRPAPCPRP